MARIAFATALLLVSCAVLPAAAGSNSQKRQLAQTQFETAERMREALNGRPERERSAREYKRVEDAYRRVYHLAPTASKADASVVAVAELLAEQGQALDDDTALKSAIGQYRFLRREYPASKYRVQALFTIGQIYKDDLNDPDQARAAFEELLKLYPRAPQAEEAGKALAAIKRAAEQKNPENAASKKDAEPPAAAGGLEPSRSSSRRLLTGIRHWSTPDYTRVAIDLEGEVKYEGWRIPNPDRIYFDLQDTRLASTLVGKSFDVEDGFLKKIRVAQYLPGQARVVLDVDDVSDYSAFLLPNPYRLIIDIHGKKSAQSPARAGQPSAPVKIADTPQTSAAADVKDGNDGKEAKGTKTPAKAKANTEVAAVRAPSPTIKDSRSPESAADPGRLDAGAKAAAPAQSSAAKSNPSGQIPRTVVDADEIPAAVDDSKDKPAKTQAKAAEDQARRDSHVRPANATLAKTNEDAAVPRSKTRSRKGRASDKLDVREAQPTLDGDRSLTRALGLKIGRIVVDAGHGGHDTGTIGPHGLQEKDLVLDVSLRLGKLLENRLGAEVIYTRDDDTFIPLETRTAIANQHEADLFISVHANSSRDPGARGVETYYLNFTSSRDALEVAARENAVSEKSIHELQDLVKKIALKEKIEESREFAFDVQQAMHSGLSVRNSSMRDRGVKKAPFIVLIGANMPSILAEISFISNPADEKRLQTPEYRQKIAESLFRGISKYVGGLSGVKVATKISKSGVQ